MTADAKTWAYRKAVFQRTILENPYIVQKPHMKQAEFLALVDIKEVLYGGAAGGGKALHVETLIPTPVGWRRMADLIPGDEVFGADGKATRIVGTSDVMTCRPCYRLTFDDGSEIVADADHLWHTFTAKELAALTRLDPKWRAARRERRPSRVSGNKSDKFTIAVIERNRRCPPKTKEPPKGSLRTTAEIAATLVVGCRSRLNHAVRIAGSLDLPEQDLPIDPYVLGIWLGDGTSTNAGLTSADQEIIDNVRAAGWSIERRNAGHDYSWMIGTTAMRERAGVGGLGRVNDFAAKLRLLGVIGNKHVPMIYLRASRTQRLSLLRGLMDADGTVAKFSGSAEFTNTNKRLAEAVVELACSLGHKANLREGIAKLNGRVIGPKWTVKWTPNEIVFRLSRKAKIQKIGTRRTKDFRYVVECERVDSVSVRCIKVAAADGMFLAGPTMVPTHNSSAILMGALQFVEDPIYNALIIQRTITNMKKSGALITRAREWLHENNGARWEDSNKTWHFPSGAKLQFGFVADANDKYHFKSSDYMYIAFEELTEFLEDDYTYLFRSLRKPADYPIPLRMRGATNPGGRGHCVPFGEVLTPTGWKGINEFAIGDPVFTVLADGSLKETVVAQIHRSHHQGKMVHVIGNSLRMTCTPNHCVAKVGGIRPGLNTREGAKDLFRLVPFEELPGQAVILRTVSWDAPDLPAFSPPIYPTRKRKLIQPSVVSGRHFVALLGWMLSEGFTVDCHKMFGISQSKERGRARISKLLDEMGFSYRVWPTSFGVYAADWWAYFRTLGKCREKHIPEWVKCGSKADLAELFSSLMAGDGCWYIEGQSGVYYTISQRLADDVAEVAVKLGFIVLQTSRQRKNRRGLSYEIKFKKTSSGGTELLTGNHVYDVETATQRRSDISRSDFDGDVYCLGIEGTHSFVIRQNGSVWVSGNSFVKKRWGLNDKGEQTEAGKATGRVFIQAFARDNPTLDQASYEDSLIELTHRERMYQKEGSWSDFTGEHFRPAAWPRYADLGNLYSIPQGAGRQLIAVKDVTVLVAVDFAISEKQTADHTCFGAGALLPDGRLFILEVLNERIRLEHVAGRLDAFCRRWEPAVVAGDDDNLSLALYNECRRQRYIPEIRRLPIKSRSKLVRAQNAIIMGENGRIYLPIITEDEERRCQGKMHWLDAYCDQLLSFTGADKAEDDMVDMTSILATLARSLRAGVSMYGAADHGCFNLTEPRSPW